MKQKLLMTLALAVMLVLGGKEMVGQVISEGFESGMPTSYTTGTVTLGSGDWTGTNIIRGTTKHSGSYSCQIRSATGAEITTPAVLTGGVSTITLWAAKSTSGTGPALQVQISVDGSEFTQVGSTLELAQNTFNEYSVSVNNAGNNIKIRFYRTTGTVYLDDVTINSFGGNTPPSISNITQSPTLPNSSQSVSVSADVTDDSELNQVTLNWGTTSGNLTNDIFMSLTTGETYTLDSDIPAQADGTIIYYEIYALDDEDASTTSPEESYTVTNLSPEPSAHVTGFAASTITTNAIPLDWTDSDADYYLIKAVETGGSITPPVDGIAEADDLLVKNIVAGTETATFTGLSSFTSYTFEIFPYNGTGTTVNYLISGTVPSVVASTLGVQITLPYTEDFSSGFGECTTYSFLGTNVWNIDNEYAQVNGYDGSNPEEDWLLLPQINFDTYSNVIMDFDNWWKWGNDDAENFLKLFYSTDYSGSGDPTGASWNELTFSSPDDNDIFGTSSVVDLTTITGSSVTIAFVYFSTTAPRHWKVDNIRVFEGSLVDVTFQVNMMDQTVSGDGVHVAGNFQGWDPATTEMTEGTTENVYEVTLPLYSDIEYLFKYINGNSWGSEETVPDECQAPGTSNRFEIIGATNYAIDPVCFSSCTNCNFMPNYDVTFQVDMANETVTEGVFLAGNFNGWSSTANPMALQSGSTTIYELTLSLEEASYITYKFINGTNWEDNIGAGCTDGGNRYYTIPAENSTIDLVCFGSCTACVQPYDITFQVNMMNETVSGDGVYLAGSFTDWGTNAIPMTQTGNIWSTTVSVMGNSTVFYKFVNGNPNSGGSWEDFSGVCLDGGNRTYTIPLENATVDQVCFNSCDACPVADFVMINEVDADTPGTDVAEFIELYDGGVGNSNLSGLVVVLFNGNGDVSYLAIDLNGCSTNADGYFVIGSTGMGTDIEISPGSSGWLQNGADAVALYVGVGADFPNGTAVTTTNLLDALVYDTNDGDDTGLLGLLNPDQPQINENEGGSAADYSMQRLPNGIGGQRNTYTYRLYYPSPGEVNEVIITAFPYIQSFDSELFAPAGWTNIKTADPVDPNDPSVTGTWDRQTTGVNPTCAPHSGAAMARYNCYSSHYGTKGELATPSITFPDDGYKVSFWMYRDTNPWGITDFIDEGVNVYYNTTNTSAGGTLLGTIYREATQTPIVDPDGWYQYTFNMPAGSAGSSRYIIFEAFSSNALNIFIDDVTIEAFTTTTWTGTTDNDWDTETNWDNGVPDGTTNVVIPPGLTNYPTLSASGACFNLTIQSDVTGDGSLLGQSLLTVSGNTTIERYTTAGVWHGISGPLANDDFNSLYFGGSPDVWGMYYNEATNDYTYASALETELGDAKGWMVWIGGSTAQTFNFTGDLRSTLTPIALTNTGADASHGYNFVGNPYPSAIDWDAASGWSNVNVDGGIWVWDPVAGDFAEYNVLGGNDNGSNFIPVGQGFFVQVTDGQSSGTLGMDTDIQVHNSVAFMKAPTELPQNFIKLQLTDGDRTDESIIHLNEAATEGYDGQLDMHKMFSFSDEQPQLYSTANHFMAINALPLGTVSVPMDVRGVDGNEMTIAIEEVTDFTEVYLSDDYTGEQTNLMEMPYTFIYNAGQTDRFTIYFTIVGTEENQLENVQVYSFDKKIRMIIPIEMNAHVEVTNMLGQTVNEMDAHLGTHDINMDHGGYYLVNITGDNQYITRKVFIK